MEKNLDAALSHIAKSEKTDASSFMIRCVGALRADWLILNHSDKPGNKPAVQTSWSNWLNRTGPFCLDLTDLTFIAMHRNLGATEKCVGSTWSLTLEGV